ncbi:OmpA family protein [Maribacter sp. SA7]|uniref:OmpA family protein n=1 Tax=Maribacter zhoushanensis TaxID=3030012 RepID=UPI0023EB8877|nr:OmpA family protein [Maribacter zhoushanensis]MDF4202632.1 OmpA family protein [Maribacter zhoushanensis]
MRKIAFLFVCLISIISCKTDTKNQLKTDDNSKPSTESETVVKEEKEPEVEKPKDELFTDNFDWTEIPLSSVHIGEFPYLAPPEGFFVKTKQGKPAKDGLTKFSDFGRLMMYTGEAFYNADGKMAKMLYGMTKKGKAFNKLLFDKSVDGYLESIGAELIFKGSVPRKKMYALDKIDPMAQSDYIVGRAYNSDPIRHYALNHKSGKIMFQVWSNTYGAEVGVVELEDFVQTIKAPTASEMKDDIDTNGKAILNINFDTDKATLKTDVLEIVDQIFILLDTNPELKLSIEGHTDNTGTDDRNKQLSIDRANTVMYALAGKGIDIKRLKASGFGSEKPLVANDTGENKAKNRRVELVKM